MDKPPQPQPASATALPGWGMSSTRQTLALHALSQLNRQIADNPDFYSLINLLLWTLCGQCSVADTFVAIHDPRSTEENLQYFATGLYEQYRHLVTYNDFRYVCDSFAKRERPLLVADLNEDNCPAAMYEKLCTGNVQVLLPLSRDERCFGLLGLGERAGRVPFAPPDVELARLLVDAVSPFTSTLSREYFDLFNSIRQGVLVFDSNEKLVRINATAKHILLDGDQDAAGAPTAFGTSLDELFADPRFGGWANQIRFGRSGERGRAMDGLVKKQMGDDRFYSARVSSINLREDGQHDLLIVLEDTTEKTLNEQRLYELQRLAERGVMTSSITHELNNYLTMALGGTEMVKRQFASGKQEQAAATLEKLLMRLNEMQRFTAGLTDQARLQSTRTMANLNTIAFDLLSFVKVQRRFKNISVDLVLDPLVPSFMLDADQVSQLLLNMLYNAADAIEEAHQEAGMIRIQTVAVNGSVDLSVRDNGCGISEALKSKLFSEQITTKERGHGFGLMMCGKIIKDHDAKVRIESDPGTGTTFHFTFPLPTTDPGAVRPQSSREGRPSDGRVAGQES